MNAIHEPSASSNGNSAFLDREANDNFTYSNIQDESIMPPGMPHVSNEQLAQILEQQNQLLMWLKTKEMAGSDKKPGITPILAVVIAALGIVGGLLASVAVNAQWKGDIEARIRIIEQQRSEDKQEWSYIRTQNEVNGKALTRIEASLDSQQKERKR